MITLNDARMVIAAAERKAGEIGHACEYSLYKRHEVKPALFNNQLLP